MILYILRQYSGLSCLFALTIQRTGSGSVAAYAADHGNDVISNLVGIAGAHTSIRRCLSILKLFVTPADLVAHAVLEGSRGTDGHKFCV
jgi:hypothetical protein